MQLLEMEESFGLVQLVKPQLAIPIVVRLHGPHFAVGPPLGVPADTTFRQRVRYEGVGIEKADAVRRHHAEFWSETQGRVTDCL